MRWIMWIMCVSSFIAASVSIQFAFDLTKEKHASLYADFDKQVFWVHLDGEKIPLTHVNEEVMDYTVVNESLKNVVFGDYNFDGYTDIAILAGVGYGGLNACRQYYFYDAKKNDFIPYSYLICNLESNRISKLLHGSMKSSATYYHSYHMIGEDGMPYKIIDAESTIGEDKMLTHYQVTELHTKKKYLLYLAPKEKSLDISVLPTMRLRVLDVFTATSKEAWVNILVRECPDIKGWVPFSVLHFAAIETKKIASVYTDKTYFYDKPYGKRSHIYIVEGDNVIVLKTEDEWLKVVYKGKKKDFTGWVKREDIDILEVVVER